ncbi:MAG: hypothetical protein M3Q14_00955 [bacterium]|nr:hypothetical protein [bacterium]
MNDNKKSLAIATLVVGLLIGGGLGYATSMNKDDDHKEESSSVATTDTKAAGLRTVLNNLESEHVDLASAATRAGFDGDPSFMAAAASLDVNSNALSDAVGSVYGEEAREKFYEIWNSHIGFFVDYTVAAKGGDQAGMDKAVQNLNGYVEAISTFLSGANPNLPKDAVAQLITEHVGLLKEAVDKHGAGDYAASYDAQMRARTQITTKIADTLAGAIVKQNPDNF